MAEALAGRGGAIHGWVIGGATLVMLAGMSYHPSINSHELLGMLKELAAEAPFSTALHSTVGVAQVALMFGMVGLSQRLGFDRPAVQAALIAYSIGSLAWLTAGVSAGWVTPAIARGYANATPDQVDAIRSALLTTGAYNQGWARVAAVLISTAMTSWSLDLYFRGPPVKAAAWIGGLSGLAIAGGVLTGLWPLSVGGALGIAILWTIWNLSIAVLLVRQRL